VPRALPAHHRQDRARHVHRSNEACCQLPVDLRRCQFLEVAGIEAGGVVDQHIDAAEAVDGRPYRGLGVRRARDVQRDGEHVARRAQHPGHSIAVSTGSHHRMAGGQRGPHEIDTHAAAGTRNQPDLFAHHILNDCTFYLLNRSIRYASSGPWSPSYASCAIASVNGSKYRAIRRGPASTGSKPTSRISCATTFFASSLLPQ